MLPLRSRQPHPFFRSVDLAKESGGEPQDPKPGICRVSIMANREAGDRLDSWKEIASHLKRTVRTVQRWENREGLPVHRHTHLKGSTVYAFKTEIDIWLTGRGQAKSEPRPMQKHLDYTANGLNPPLYVTRQMSVAFRLWLAMVERESYQSFDETVVPDLTLTPHDRYFFIQGPKSERKVRS